MRIAIIVNPTKTGSAETLLTVQNKLSTYNNVEYFVSTDNDFQIEIDLIFVVGGDGTLLLTVSKAVEHDVPVICFNTGKVGFLSEVDNISDVDRAIEKIMNSDYSIEERALLEVKSEGRVYYALNEVSLMKNEFSSLIKTYVYKDDFSVTSFSADGIMVCTPTGSTAYSLSAGGPIMSPTMRAMLLTPVCAHVLFSRPMVFDGIEALKLGAESPNGVIVSIDGVAIDKFTEKRFVEVTIAEKTLKLIKINHESLYTKLQKKLLQWTVENKN